MNPSQQIMTGHPPYAEIISDLAVAFEVMMKKTPPVRPDFSHFFENKGAEDKLWALLAKCWARVPGDRPTGAEVKAAVGGLMTPVGANAELATDN